MLTTVPGMWELFTTIFERITINNDYFWDIEFKEGGGFLLFIFVNCLNFCNKYYLYNSKNKVHSKTHYPRELRRYLSGMCEGRNIKAQVDRGRNHSLWPLEPDR